MKIGVIHANRSAVAPLEEAFRAEDASVEVVNYIDEELLRLVDRAGGVTPEALRRFARTVFRANEEGMDGLLIACSVYCAYAGAVRPFLDIPILAVDAPALEEIAARGGKVGILATTAASAPACQEKLERLCVARGTAMSYEYGICTEALEALRRGDGAEHDRLLAEEAMRLASLGCDTLFLSQISMARARAAMGALAHMTITTPQTGVRELLRQVQSARQA